MRRKRRYLFSAVIVIAVIAAIPLFNVVYHIFWAFRIEQKIYDAGGGVGPQGNIYSGRTCIDFRLPGHNSRATNAQIIEVIDSLKSLEYLDISKSSVDDTVIAHLELHNKLEVLHLYDTKITDACLESIQKMPSLKYLDLSGTTVTDKAVDSLIKMPQLEYIGLGDTNISQDGIQRIRLALPNTAVNLDRHGES